MGVGIQPLARQLSEGAAIAFFLVHIFEVLVTGAVNNVRSMITGRYRIGGEEHEP